MRWNDQPIWVDRLWIGAAVIATFWLGIQYGRVTPNGQLAHMTEQALQAGEQCVQTLDGITRAAVIFAAQSRTPLVRRASQ